MTNRYELARLEGIIRKDIPSFLKRKCTLDRELLEGFKDAIHKEVERVKLNLIEATFNYRKKRTIEMYVQYHELAIIRLSGYLTQYVPPTRINRLSHSLDNAVLSQQLYSELKELLRFVDLHFSQYHNLDAWIPESYWLIVKHELEKSIGSLRKTLAIRRYSPGLINHALSPFNDFLKESSTTYRRVTYLKELQRQLHHLTTDTNELNECEPDTPLQWVLFRINYNTVAYYNYCTHEMRRFLDEAEDVPGRMERLALLLKLIRQQPVIPGYCYDLNNKSLKEQLSEWVAQEIIYMEMQQASIETETPSRGDKAFRVKVDLSVAQLAYFTRVLKESGVVQREKVTVLAHKITQAFETKRAETMSTKSFENQYYDVEHSTKQSIKTVLLKMIRYIDESH